MNRTASIAVALTASAASLLVPVASAEAAPGGVPIVNAHSGKCMDLAAGATQDGGPVTQFACHYRENQRWHVTKAVASTAVKLRNAASNRCLDVAEKSKRSGAAVHQWDCQDGDRNTDASDGSQLWQINSENGANGWTYFRVTNLRSGKCLDVPGGSTTDGVVLIQYDCTGRQNQQWRMPDSAGR